MSTKEELFITYIEVTDPESDFYLCRGYIIKPDRIPGKFLCYLYRERVPYERGLRESQFRKIIPKI